MTSRRTLADLGVVGFFLLVVAGLWALGGTIEGRGGDGTPFRGLAGLLSVSVGLLVALRFTPLRRFPGLLVGLLFLGLLVGVNLAPEVAATQVEAFGAELAGIPMPVVVSIVEVLGLGPAVVALGVAGVPLVSAAMRAGIGSRLGMVAWVVTGDVPPELAGHRRLALAPGAWCASWMVGWIAYAAFWSL